MGYVKHTDDFTGKQHHYLKVIGRNREGFDIWKSRCICGQIYMIPGWYLRNDKRKSCGCMTKKLLSQHRTIHGRSRENSEHYNTFYVWRSMKARCFNENHKSFKDYGGRGIKVSKRWLKFTNFLEDMGDVPKGMTLGRINNNGNYSKSNCRWESYVSQSNNRRSNRILIHNGQSLTLQQWSAKTGIARDAIWHRINSGWPIEKALTQKPKKQKNSRYKFITGKERPQDRPSSKDCL